MTKSIQQIKKDLQNLESTAVETAIELEKLYQDYLSLLGKSVKQQLILASYQICTQFYPQSFLDLSLNRKQELQQTLKQIAAEVEPALLSISEQKELEPEPRQLNLMAELVKHLPKPPQRDLETDELEENESDEVAIAEINLESVKAELEKIELIEIGNSLENDADLEDTDSKDTDSKTPKQKVDFKNPEHLILWHKQIERALKKTLDNTSQKANKRLQDLEIIPNRIPNSIIDVAIQADSNRGRSDRKAKNVPNILHLSIENEGNKQKSKSKSESNNIINISLLRLRLTELEFGDPMLNAQRGKIRNLASKISKLNSQYQRTKHEAKIAEAQAAWRSSWYED